MVSENQSLLDALGQLKSAIENEDWLRAEQIDQTIKADIDSALLNVKTDDEKASLTELLTKVQSLYKLLISNTEGSRRKISAELKKITSDKKVSNFYLKSSQYK